MKNNLSKNKIKAFAFFIIMATFFIPKLALAGYVYYPYAIPYDVLDNPSNITVILKADPQVMTWPASTTTLRWSTTGSPDSCEAYSAWNGFKDPTSGSEVVTGLSIGANIFEITCLKGSDTARSSVLVYVKNNLPDLIAGYVSPVVATTGIPVTFNSNISNQGSLDTGIDFSVFFQLASSINGGGTITDLAPSSMGALASSATNVASSPVQTFTNTGTYSVRACADKSSSSDAGAINESDETNNCGSWVTVTVSDPSPTLTLSAQPLSIASGASATLSWVSTNLTACTASASPVSSTWTGARVTNSVAPHESTGALTSTTTFYLNCTGSYGPKSSEVTVTVAGDPKISYFQPYSCVGGGSNFGSYPKFAWASENTSSCTITRITDPVINQSVGVSSEISGGSLEFGNLYYFLTNIPVVGDSSKYRLQCTNGSSLTEEFAEVNVCSPDFTISAVPTVKSFVNGINPGTGKPGKLAVYTISVNSIGGFNKDVEFAVQSDPGMPASTSFTFTPTSVAFGSGAYSTSTFVIGIDDSDFPTPDQRVVYTPIVISGDGGGTSHTTSVTADATGKKRPVYIER